MSGRFLLKFCLSFSSRKAYIYALEMLAQIVAAITCHDILCPCWLGFCDNSAGKAALAKGYGKSRWLTTCWHASGRWHR